MAAKAIVPLGSVCTPDTRARRATPPPHTLVSLESDRDFAKVLAWFEGHGETLADAFARAAMSTMMYVLDAPRTGRVDLHADNVDKDERSSIGTKLQYHVVEELGLIKGGELDTVIEGIPVEIKSTVRTNWTIPLEGQCEITLAIQLDANKRTVDAFLIRAHRAWLNDGKNQDKKTTFSKNNFNRYAVQLFETKSLPVEPLMQVTEEQRDLILRSDGFGFRYQQLFAALPDSVIPRYTLRIVGGDAEDFMKRAREAKPEIAAKLGLVTLVGKWPAQRRMAELLGFSLGTSGWVAVSAGRVDEYFESSGVAPHVPSDTSTDFLKVFSALPPETAASWLRVFPHLSAATA